MFNNALHTQVLALISLLIKLSPPKFLEQLIEASSFLSCKYLNFDFYTLKVPFLRPWPICSWNSTNCDTKIHRKFVHNQFMLRKLVEGINLLSFSKTWSIVTHAETASLFQMTWFGTDPLIRKLNLIEDLCYATLRQNQKCCERKLICILQSNNLLTPWCSRNTISGNNIGSKADENLIRKWVLSL